MYINFSNIPANQNLFLDYLEEFENVSKFYSKNFRDKQNYEKLFQKIKSSNREHKELLSNIIINQYNSFNASEKTKSNIELLKLPNTIAIVTGQQLGIFGGPLYTLLKSITAIKLSEKLQEEYPEYNFVPIFWLEGDDHDFDEVRKFNVLNNENNLIEISYHDGADDEINRGSIGQLKFNDNINLVFDELQKSLRDTEFKASLIDYLKTIYTPDKTFLESFKELMIHLFDKHGLIFFNPLDKEVKNILKPVFTKAITEYQTHSLALVERSASLEEIYHAQVKVKAINLFYAEEKDRSLIEPTESGDFRLRGKRKKFTYTELMNLIETTPEKFSPNVLLRPICQDYLFPTGFYVGGPSEISYFAQVNPLYELFNIEEPFIYPRASATIVEQGVNQVLSKYNLSITEIFVQQKELIEKIIRLNSELNTENIFNEANHQIENVFKNITENISKVDKTLEDLSQKSLQKIQQTLDYLRSKTSEAEKRKYEITIRQLSKVQNVLYPNQNLQERELNFIYFVNKYGMDFLKWLFDEIKIDKFSHQILNM
ncbi:MAG: bacillithiol biosynthesis cysteine-adding enzyme BshC [Melioribacteraceae bacterium]|nr:bacillithiol biosynthesis cysteine-adding enzyme BshC [Melioribacteraceae bacterium]